MLLGPVFALVTGAQATNLTPMNFVLAVLAYAGMGALLGFGILRTSVGASGGLPLLILGLVVFLGIFIKAGCLSSQD